MSPNARLRIDPKNVNLEVAGATLTIRAEQPGENGERGLRYEQSFTVPQFLALDKITARAGVRARNRARAGHSRGLFAPADAAG